MAEPNNYSAWFQSWGRNFWALVHFGSLGGEEYREEFYDTLTVTRRQMQKALRKKGQADAGRIFFKQWLKRYSTKNRQSLPFRNDLDWESRFLLGGLFQLGWKPDLLCSLYKLTAPSLRFRAFQALKFYSRVDEKKFRHETRDCVRNDLYFLDLALDLNWKDPIGLAERQRLIQHQKTCSRCSALSQELNQNIKRIKEEYLHEPPQDVMDWFARESGSVTRLLSPRWFAAWPWYARVPVQIGLVAGVVTLVMMTPYMGDLFGPLKKSSKTEVAVEKPAQEKPSAKTIVDVTETPDPLGTKSSDPVAKVEAVAKPTAPIVAVAPPNENALAHVKVADDMIVMAEQKPTPATPPPVETPQPAPPATGVGTPTLQQTPAKPTAAETVVLSAAPDFSFYRWGAFSIDLSKDADAIIGILNQHKAEKAGEYDFGADYKGGKYFHFFLDKAQYADALQKIKGLALPEFTSNKASSSERKNPEGKTRIVFLMFPKAQPAPQ